MFKKILAGLLAWAMTAAPALAEAYTGSTMARSTLAVTAQASGVLEEIRVLPGSTVAKDDQIAALRTTKVFASQDGTISRIHAGEGSVADGTVLELSPVSRYTVYCTADEAYDSISSNLVHCGETLYLYCTYNGTHQGTGMVYSIDGETYMVEATGGEFYVGETLYLYRDAGHSYKYLVGKGTVVASATELYEGTGKITAMHVSAGEYVERGELLYEIIDGDGTAVLSPVSGVITACAAEEGSAVQDGQVIATLAPWDEICVAIEVSEEQAWQINPGDQAALSYAGDPEEKLIPGEVIEISQLAGDGTYTVYIAPETPPVRTGMTVNVRLG